MMSTSHHQGGYAYGNNFGHHSRGSHSYYNGNSYRSSNFASNHPNGYNRVSMGMGDYADDISSLPPSVDVPHRGARDQSSSVASRHQEGARGGSGGEGDDSGGNDDVNEVFNLIQDMS